MRWAYRTSNSTVSTVRNEPYRSQHLQRTLYATDLSNWTLNRRPADAAISFDLSFNRPKLRSTWYYGIYVRLLEYDRILRIRYECSFRR